MTRRWPGLAVGPPDRDTDPDRLARVVDDDPVGPLWRGAQIFRLLSYLYALGFHIAVNPDLDRGGVAWVLEQDYGLKLPKRMQADFSTTVQESGGWPASP